jgi:hypothetical protein
MIGKIIGLAILILFTFISLFWNAYKHGQRKEGKYSFWVTLIAAVIEWGLILMIIYL